MSTSIISTTGTVTVVERPTPMVLSVARRLRQSFAGGATFSPIEELRVVRLKSATDAQQVFVSFYGPAVCVAADSDQDVELTAEARWTDPVPEEWEEAAAGTFAQELHSLLSGVEHSWQDAAQSFWARARGLPGMPASLGVYCFDENSTAEFGDSGTDHYQFLGTSVALARLFSGSSLITDELRGGELALDGTSANFSALMGANLKVVCGEI